MMPVEAIPPLALFAAVALLSALYVLAASGHFPRRQHVAAGTAIEGAVLWGASAAAVIALSIALAAAWLLVPWYAAVIAGGLTVLAAPPLLQVFPDSFVDGRSALLTFAGASGVLALALLWLIQAA